MGVPCFYFTFSRKVYKSSRLSSDQMPAESKQKQLVLAILRSKLESKKTLAPSQIAGILGKTDKNTINLVRHYLLDLWKNGVLIRSEREIGLEYYYFFGKKDRIFSFNGQKIVFAAYSEKVDSRNIKAQIKHLLQTKGPLAVTEVCAELKPNFDLAFQKKINFHLQDLFKKGEVLRSSKPYQYYLSQTDALNVSKIKASVPTILLTTLRENKNAFFTSELVEELKKKGITPKLSTISLALQRLCRQQIIVSSKTKFGTRSSKTGYLWAAHQEEIKHRFWQELSPTVQKLLSAEIVSVNDVGQALKISPSNALRWMKRVSVELPEFEFAPEFASAEGGIKLQRKTNVSK